MKNRRIAAYLLWLGCVIGVTRSSAQITQGPSVEDTLIYINAAKPQQYKNDLDPPTLITLSKDHRSLHIVLKDSDADGVLTTSDYWVDILELDPSATGVTHDGTIRDWISIDCSQKQMCAHTSYWGRYTGSTFEKGSQFTFHITADADKADRVARALRHLVEILQAEYRQSHSSPSDPNDPFSKPPR